MVYRFLDLFFGEFKCVRKYLGGRWLRVPGGLWMRRNDPGDDWPIEWQGFETEEYNQAERE